MQSGFCPAARRPVGGQTDDRGLAARWAKTALDETAAQAPRYGD
jgi:hypothetical protein